MRTGMFKIFAIGATILMCLFWLGPVRVSAVEEGESEALLREDVSEDFSSLRSALSALNQFPGASPQILLGRAVRVATGIMGSIALIMFIYAGIIWMIAGGNADRQRRAMNIMLWTALALAVILTSYAIVSYFLGNFG